MNNNKSRTAIITGGSRGFGKALAISLLKEKWNVVINGRNAEDLLRTKNELSNYGRIEVISGDVRDEVHLLQFPELLDRLDLHLDLIVNNASTLGMSPQPETLNYSIDALHKIFHTNVLAPLSLLQKLVPYIKSEAVIANISSDAAVNHYENWGGYGASKAALDHLTATMAKEYPYWKIYSFDPGDMQTDLHQAAFPGEDITDRPFPEVFAIPAFRELLNGLLPSGRYTPSKIMDMTLSPLKV